MLAALIHQRDTDRAPLTIRSIKLVSVHTDSYDLMGQMLHQVWVMTYQYVQI
ncbi:hypothetical protein O23A_p2602 [Aeromonas salmonicida]|nr:hypothetical protein O23A_p2602 [Aeromonas salmonicida]